MLAVDEIMREVYASGGVVSGALFSHLRERYLLTREALPVRGEDLAAEVVRCEQGMPLSSAARGYLMLDARGRCGVENDASAPELWSYGALLCAALCVGNGDVGRERLRAMSVLRREYSERYWRVREAADVCDGVEAWAVQGWDDTEVWVRSDSETARLRERVRVLARCRRLEDAESSAEFWKREFDCARNECGVESRRVCCQGDVQVRQQLSVEGEPMPYRPVVLPGRKGGTVGS